MDRSLRRFPCGALPSSSSTCSKLCAERAPETEPAKLCSSREEPGNEAKACTPLSVGWGSRGRAGVPGGGGGGLRAADFFLREKGEAGEVICDFAWRVFVCFFGVIFLGVGGGGAEGVGGGGREAGDLCSEKDGGGGSFKAVKKRKGSEQKWADIFVNMPLWFPCSIQRISLGHQACCWLFVTPFKSHKTGQN